MLRVEGATWFNSAWAVTVGGQVKLEFRSPSHSHPPKIIPTKLYLNGKVVSKVAPHSPVSDPL